MAESNNCWDLNPDCGEGIDKCSSCPAHKAKKSCWEFDWKPIASVCDESLKPYWEKFIEKRCILMDCPVYSKNKKEIDEIMLLFEKCSIM